VPAQSQRHDACSWGSQGITRKNWLQLTGAGFGMRHIAMFFRNCAEAKGHNHGCRGYRARPLLQIDSHSSFALFPWQCDLPLFSLREHGKKTKGCAQSAPACRSGLADLLDDEFCHAHSEHLRKASERLEKQGQDRRSIAELTDFVSREDSSMLPAILATGRPHLRPRRIELS
jgi:hypothetical protein